MQLQVSVLLSLLLSLRESGHRTLIFSQSRVMLDLIQVRCRATPAAAGAVVVTLWQVVLADPSAAASALHLQAAAQNMRAFKCVRIDGSISSSSDRQSRIASFNTDASIDVFLLTTQCGGVGITLNGADRVVIFDPAWNPAVDAQVGAQGIAAAFLF